MALCVSIVASILLLYLRLWVVLLEVVVLGRCLLIIEWLLMRLRVLLL